MTEKVTKLFAGDTRCVPLIDQLLITLETYGDGLSIPAIIGCLELVKMQVLTDEDFHEQ